MTNPPVTVDQVALGHALLAARPGLRTCLQALPSPALSPTGRANLCRRFGLSDAELAAALAVSHPAPASH